ncbi:MAG: hypothetical protein IJV83_00095 [Clostridia bacterium]|nr:hypothetical protein [Clostridia bacterium]
MNNSIPEFISFVSINNNERIALQLDNVFWYVDTSSNSLKATTELSEKPFYLDSCPDETPPLLLQKIVEVMKNKITFCENNPTWFYCNFIKIQIKCFPPFSSKNAEPYYETHFAIRYHRYYLVLNSSGEWEKICPSKDITVLKEFEKEEFPSGYLESHISFYHSLQFGLEIEKEQLNSYHRLLPTLEKRLNNYPKISNKHSFSIKHDEEGIFPLLPDPPFVTSNHNIHPTISAVNLNSPKKKKNNSTLKILGRFFGVITLVAIVTGSIISILQKLR